MLPNQVEDTSQIIQQNSSSPITNAVGKAVLSGGVGFGAVAAGIAGIQGKGKITEAVEALKSFHLPEGNKAAPVILGVATVVPAVWGMVSGLASSARTNQTMVNAVSTGAEQRDALKTQSAQLEQAAVIVQKLGHDNQAMHAELGKRPAAGMDGTSHSSPVVHSTPAGVVPHHGNQPHHPVHHTSGAQHVPDTKIATQGREHDAPQAHQIQR